VIRFFYRIADFFHHWYVHGSRRLIHSFLNLFESLDRTFALVITVRYFFVPLYKDYSIVGRILGIMFRSVRVAVGVFVYVILGAACFVVYLVWLLLPLGVILSMIR